MNKFRLLFLFIVISFGLLNKSFATHIRGGNISVSVISTRPLVVLFKVSLYRDSNSFTNIGNGLLYFWDGTSVRLRQNADSIDIKYLGNQIEEYIFYISHAYHSGTGFIAPFYFEANRNAGTVNLQNSVSIPFFIETQIVIAPNGQINNSPIFQIPPNDEGVVGELFIHNVGAYDPDGDSLSYELITPYQQKEIEVVSYEIPDSSWIDKYGNIYWDKPVFVGQYTYALRVTEWRFFDGKWQDIGFVIRDMQVYIRDLPNAPPTITPNGSICVVAGETAIIDMVVEDPNDNMISVELFNDLNL
ncbi:MAG: gliding motility-associated C-terminal domain-containing protein, partial [Bacteroidetes bacterium]